ncbi:LysR family transcriptional regulator [Phytohabitans aurantiacus]|jgi:DNA-binding transcriptional LysR family regulator|uniref:LysR family transcriptional regulator n=1 Tax=Phytohabitans aurantiacus TaxID=3016789 RepID=A0ABQ5R139_9ACTN|nr:LysR family transcriptional regulator [Phytohabitans aurantiacus]GLI00519.1 LysR family transcriptional regulator [Phytohabitans aurantiacus]
MELRDIEIFLAVAEELHFGRAAQKLHVSQARVSQSIKKQERRVGGLLFERTSRMVQLTPIGSRLRSDLREAYDLIQNGLATASGAAHGTFGTLRLGVMGVMGNEIRPLTAAFTARYPSCPVEVTEFHFSDPFSALRAGDVDVQLMWLPVREDDLTVGPVVRTEGRALAVPETCDLAGRQTVSLEDLAGRTTPDPGPEALGYWLRAMFPASTPGGRLIRRGPRARTCHELLTLVAAGQVVSPVNAHFTRYYTYPGVVYLPIEDAPPTEWALVWRTGRETPVIRAFAQLAQCYRHRPSAGRLGRPQMAAAV